MTLHPHFQNAIAERIAAGIQRYSKAGPVARYAGAWDESKHPRGNPKNAGEFSSHGGGGTATKAPPKVLSDTGGSGTSMHQPGGKPQTIQPGAKGGDSSQSGRTHKSASVPGESPQTARVVQDLGAEQQPTTPPPPGKVYAPDPAQGKAARVGVPGDTVPPPPKEVPRLPNLNPEERAVEHEFATMFEQDPDGTADQMIDAMSKGMGDGPNIFATDEAKGLFDKWKGTKVTGPDGKSDLSPETKAFRSKYNTALHQTANAVAKRAFLKYLDTVVATLPEGERNVLATAGGVAAGKGYAIANVGEVNEISKKASATWDSAGEQNSTELPWLAEECKKRGIKLTAVFVHANPKETWENPSRGVVERAGKKGRMVDARVFADSYTHGARNFDAFQKKYGNDPNIHIAVLDNTAGVPQKLARIPAEALVMNSEHLYARCLGALDQPNVPAPVKQGGSAGTRIWGPPAA